MWGWTGHMAQSATGQVLVPQFIILGDSRLDSSG